MTNPRRYTRQALARTAAGKPCKTTDPAAVAWAADGALRKIITNPAQRRFVESEYTRSAAIRMGYPTLLDASDDGGPVVAQWVFASALNDLNKREAHRRFVEEGRAA